MRSAIRSIMVGSALALVLTGYGEVRAHGEEGMVVASTASGGGALTIAFDFGRVMPVSFVVEAGGQPVDRYFPCLIPAPHAE